MKLVARARIILALFLVLCLIAGASIFYVERVQEFTTVEIEVSYSEWNKS